MSLNIKKYNEFCNEGLLTKYFIKLVLNVVNILSRLGFTQFVKLLANNKINSIKKKGIISKQEKHVFDFGNYTNTKLTKDVKVNPILNAIRESRNEILKMELKEIPTGDSFFKLINTKINEKLNFNCLIQIDSPNWFLQLTGIKSVTPIIEGFPITNVIYVFPTPFNKEKIVINHVALLRDYYLNTTTNMFEKYLEVLKIFIEQQMIYRNQAFLGGTKAINKPVGLKGLIGYIYGIGAWDEYGGEGKIEAHAATIVRLMQRAGYTKDDIIHLINLDKTDVNSIIFPIYSYKDINKYFSAKSKVWKKYLEYIKLYTDKYYDKNIKESYNWLKYTKEMIDKMYR